MRNLCAALILCAAAALGGCAQVQNAWSVITGASVPPSAVFVAGYSFDAIETTATNYLKLPKCTGANGPACRNPKATAALIPAISAGRVARNNLEQYLAGHPGQLGPSGLYDAVKAAGATIVGIFAQYNINIGA